MATVSRKLPQSNLSRELAIRQAHNKMTLVNPADMPHSTNTNLAQCRLANGVRFLCLLPLPKLQQKRKIRKLEK